MTDSTLTLGAYCVLQLYVLLFIATAVRMLKKAKCAHTASSQLLAETNFGNISYIATFGKGDNAANTEGRNPRNVHQTFSLGEGGGGRLPGSIIRQKNKKSELPRRFYVFVSLFTCVHVMQPT